MGRTARHPKGRVILYADKTTKSMAAAMKEIKRRRRIQKIYNKSHNISPKAVVKPVRAWQFSAKEKIMPEFWFVKDKKILEKEMLESAKNLDFERAASLRDLIKNRKNGTNKTK